MYFTSNKLVLFTLSSFQSTRLNDQFVLLVVRLRSLLTDYHFISKIVRSKTSCRLITCAFSDFCVPQYMFTSFLNMVSWCEIMFFFYNIYVCLSVSPVSSNSCCLLFYFRWRQRRGRGYDGRSAKDGVWWCFKEGQRSDTDVLLNHIGCVRTPNGSVLIPVWNEDYFLIDSLKLSFWNI